MRGKVVRVMKSLKNDGFKPKIVFTWRSVAVQHELVEQRRSTVRFGFHNAQKKNGTPNTYAVDVIDRRYAWNDEAESSGFWSAPGKADKRLKPEVGPGE